LANTNQDDFFIGDESMTLLEKVKQNLIVQHNEDDIIISSFISAAIDYAESYQHIPKDSYGDPTQDRNTIAVVKMSPETEQAIIMLASNFYESRNGSTNGFSTGNVHARQQSLNAINDLLRLDRTWKV
jgi:uncharacterized phage protein (predicted DNA packaging)